MSEESLPFGKEFDLFAKELARQSNANSSIGAVLITASQIEDLLGERLSAYFVKGSTSDGLLSFAGPLGTLAAKSKACYALGLLSRTELQAIDRIMSIRNLFAHKVGVDFDDQEIANHTLELARHVNLHKENLGHEMMKTLFADSAIKIVLRLTMRKPNDAQRSRSPDVDWPVRSWEPVPDDQVPPFGGTYVSPPVPLDWDKAKK